MFLNYKVYTKQQSDNNDYKTMKTLRDLTLEQRTQIGQYYKDGLTAKDIAPLYGIKKSDVNNTIAFLRSSGVEIPFKVKKKKHKELLILPTDFKSGVSPKTKHTKMEKREAYRIYRTAGSIEAVMTELIVSKEIAYYLMKQGRELSGVKAPRRGKRARKTSVAPKITSKVESPDRFQPWFVFVSGGIWTLIIQQIFW